MPSFIIHSVAGEELCKRLGFDKEMQNMFFVGNLLPDTVQLERNPNWSPEELRKAVQKEKHISHFRTNLENILLYPDLKFFLSEYENIVKDDIVALGYFFHLYTDYYYFAKFLPKMITFLMEDKENVAKIKIDNKYNRINKTGKVIPKSDFWSKTNEDGIYGEYNRLNKYIINKYNFRYNVDLYRRILNDNFIMPIKEIKVDGIDNLLDELNGFYKKSIESSEEEFRIFNKSDVDNLITDVVDNFLINYNYLIRK